MIFENIFLYLFKSRDFFEIASCYIKDKYFTEDIHVIIFNKIIEYKNKYDKQPSFDDIKLLIESDRSISDDNMDSCYEFLSEIENKQLNIDAKLILKETEAFCQERALELAVYESVNIIKNKKESNTKIETVIRDALAIEFDVKIGLDLYKDAIARYESYTEDEEVIPTDIEALNILLNGGFRRKAIASFLGKCVCGNTLISVRNKKTGMIETLKIHTFFNRFKCLINALGFSMDKFEESYLISDYEILSDVGWVDATHIHKTKPFDVYFIETDNQKTLECADTHIAYDKAMNEIYVKDLMVGSIIKTTDGFETVTSIEKTDRCENMYDITVNHNTHRYYTNHILSHNTNVGKSLILCHLAASFVKSGYNVIYISAEMSESMIFKRIDANLLDIKVNDINKSLHKKTYLNKIKTLIEANYGKLIVKEYPTGVANSNNIKHLLREINQKRGYMPDVVILDYLNIFSSHKLSGNSSSNTYTYIKAICEEMRSVAVECNVALVTATQTNRDGQNKGTDLEMDSISDSYGTAQTVDYLCGIIQTPELFEQKKYLFKNLKSRYNSNINEIVSVGVEYDKMRLINLNDDERVLSVMMKDKIEADRKKEENQSSMNSLGTTNERTKKDVFGDFAYGD